MTGDYRRLQALQPLGARPWVRSSLWEQAVSANLAFLEHQLQFLELSCGAPVSRVKFRLCCGAHERRERAETRAWHRLGPAEPPSGSGVVPKHLKCTAMERWGLKR